MGYHQKGDDSKAIRDLTDTVRLNPTFAIAYNNLAWLLATSPHKNPAMERRQSNTPGLGHHTNPWHRVVLCLHPRRGVCGTRRIREACESVEKALTLAASDEDKETCTYTLELFKQGKPYRESPVP